MATPRFRKPRLLLRRLLGLEPLLPEGVRQHWRYPHLLLTDEQIMRGIAADLYSTQQLDDIFAALASKREATALTLDQALRDLDSLHDYMKDVRTPCISVAIDSARKRLVYLRSGGDL